MPLGTSKRDAKDSDEENHVDIEEEPEEEEASRKTDELPVSVLTALTGLKQARYRHCLAEAQIVVQTLVAAVVESGHKTASIQEALERFNNRRAKLAKKQQKWEKNVRKRTIKINPELFNRKKDHCEALLAYK
eukprot:1880486-Amphidinium_carterae.1